MALLAGPLPAADGFCASHQAITEALVQRMGEAKTGIGVRDPDSLLELWQSRRGTWTLVQRYADGRSCIVATGEDWVELGPSEPA
ncbi:hypothetical protein AIOL_001227 [Candidatus Rhodobacter oscarellae]|uniref:Uncharacterized protein n=2 Tax=Candidatus Rhodobacter oscarellae TaxID=1675527 RepID=A0A0J9E0M4_9RHOB|nr:hypothetical protein AIOL_001227 [Candidatus Rhodobacter lobularis]